MRPLFVKPWVEVAEIAGRQHGVISSAQLAEAGVSADMLKRALANGRLHRVHHGVFAVGHVPTTKHARWMAAVLACGPGAVLSHRSAAALWRIREAETARTEVTIAPGSGRRRPGIVIHRSPLPPEHMTTRDGIPATTPDRTLIDLSRQIHPDELARALRETFHRRLITLPSLQRALDHRPSRPLTRQIQAFADTRSHLEDDFMRLLDRHGIPRPLTQQRVETYVVDFLWPEDRLVVETDGWESHGTRMAFERDRAQTNALQLAGYTVLRLTAADVRRRGRRTAALIRQASSRSRSRNVASMPRTSATIRPR